MAKWYLGSMNDALFIIDKPPMPAPDDTGPYEMPNGPKPISAAIDERNGELIVTAHNATIATLTAALEEARGALEEIVKAQNGPFYICTERGQFVQAISAEGNKRARTALVSVTNGIQYLTQHLGLRRR